VVKGRSVVSFRRFGAILAICLLAFSLRVFHLGTQSLWYDEGLSVYLANLPPLNTIQTSAITDHPPLHALMLGAWMRVAGRSEFAVRFVSLWWSVLAVALTWQLGRELLTDAIGAVGAGLMAASALAVWYAQETRGYSLLLALTLISAWAFARFCHSESGSSERGASHSHGKETLRFAQGDRWAGVTLVVSSVAALYTHYYAVFTLLALNLAFLAVLACKMQEARSMKLGTHGANDTCLASRILRLASRFWFSQLVIVAGFAPWLPSAIRQVTTNVTYFPGRVGWQTVVGDTLRAFATGDVAPTAVAAWAVGTVGVLAVVGMFVEQPGTTRLNRVTAVLLVAAPVVAMTAIAWNKPKFAPRYLIEALPAFCLLVGAGLTAMLRESALSARQFIVGFVALVLIVVLLVASALSLRATYFDPARQRPDVRGVAAYIAANEQPGDVIVLLSGHQLPVFEYYYRGKNPFISMPNSIMPPAQSPLDYRAARQLNDIAYRHDRLWLVLWQRELADPTDVVMNELLTKTRRLGVGQDFHEMRLMLFDVQDHKPLGDGPQHALDVRFSDPIALVGYDVNATTRAPGESLDLALYWQASGRTAANYQIFTHLLATDRKMVGGSDHIAGADNYPTSLWTDGTLIRNTFTLRVPPDAPAGWYTIEVGLYDSRGRLKLTDGADRILLSEIVVK
jgi:mannosyltransferase